MVKGEIVESAGVGLIDPEVENENGFLLRNPCLDFNLAAPSTYGHNEPTYVSGSDVSVHSRIDYLLVPRGMHESGVVQPATVEAEWARRLQLVDSSRPVDHKPVTLQFPSVTLEYGERDQRVTRDRDKLVTRGTADSSSLTT